MENISLLDCTLRDGGYINDWKFGHNNIIGIFERLADAGVDIIEIGFLDQRRPYDEDRSIYPNTDAVDLTFMSIDKKNSMVVAMIDYGMCDISNLKPAANSFVDGIRVIFKKGKMHDAMRYCAMVKELGYKVFSQLVSVTSYDDNELRELISIVNEVKPYCVSMVDTYGLMDAEQLSHIYNIIEDNLEAGIRIGFHAHNNFQLAYANSLAFLKTNSRHNIVVDGTLFGMGKSAGNAPVELLAMSLNERYRKNYNIDSMLESINESIQEIYNESPWGYKMFFYLCAKNKCHPNYLSDYQSEENLSISMLDQALSTIEPKERKLLYAKDVSVSNYDEFVKEHCADEDSKNRFRDYVGNRKVLLIGPGKNIWLQNEKVKAFISENDCVKISINYIPPQINVDCIFVTNPKRYHDMTMLLKEPENQNIRILATTNVTCRNGNFEYIVERSELLEKTESISDNSFLMMLKLLNDIGIKDIVCAGFDGYSDKESNYYNPEMEYSFIKNEAESLNRHMRHRIQEYRKLLNLSFITYSAYDVVEDIGNAGI